VQGRQGVDSAVDKICDIRHRVVAGTVSHQNQKDGLADGTDDARFRGLVDHD
jgi:hypothetical protein